MTITIPGVPGSRWRLGAPGVIAVLLGGAVYLNALGNPFVYDDHATVVYNRFIRDLGDLAALVAAHPFRPITALSYAVDYAVWGLDPFGYHLTSVIIHMANVALLFAVTRRAVADLSVRYGAGDRGPEPAAASAPAEGGPPVEAFTAAALFAVHPMMTEAVGYISGRSELLCGALFFLGLLCMRRGLILGRRGAVAAALALFALALASKEVAVMAPFVVLVYDRLLLGGSPEARRRRLLRLHLPLIGAVIALGALRTAVFLWVELPVRPGTGWPVWKYLLTQFEIVWRYVLLLIAPASQSIVHSVRPIATPLDPQAWLWAACLATACALAFRERHAAPLVAFGAAWFFLVLVPSSSLAPLPEPMAEHRVYLASAGLFIATGSVVGRLVRRSARWRPWAHVVPRAALLAVLVTLAALTIARNSVWADPVSLWRDAAGKAQNTWAYLSLGHALRDRTGCHEAIPAYREAVRLSPRRALAYWHLRSCLLEVGRALEAEETLTALREFDPALAGLCRELRASSPDPRRLDVPECTPASQATAGAPGPGR